MTDAVRCFVALPVPPEVRERLARVCARLRGEPWAGGLRFVAEDAFHVTLRFLGDVASSELPALFRLLDGCAERGTPIALDLSGLTGFPSLRRARVLVAEMSASPVLQVLAMDLDRALARHGIPPERRRLRPHVTLARARRGPLELSVETALAPCPFVVRELVLVQSRLERTGARYERLHTAALD